MGFIAGLISGPYVLPDLDLDVYFASPRERVHWWGFLWGLGFGVVGSVVLLAFAVRRRMSPSFPRERRFVGLTPILVALLLIPLSAFVAEARIFLPREAVVQNRCTNNLKAIALAMYAYHDEFGCLPPAYIPDENGRPKHSWRVLILPYLDKTGFADPGELKQLYESYDFAEPWDGPHNRKLAHRMPLVYGCRNDPGRRASNTCYLVISGKRTAFPGSRSTKLDDIHDGTDKTILAVEAGNFGIDWMEPKDYPIEELTFRRGQALGRRIGGDHLGGANAGFADGSVHFLKESKVSDDMFKALATIGGREEIDEDRL